MKYLAALLLLVLALPVYAQQLNPGGGIVTSAGSANAVFSPGPVSIPGNSGNGTDQISKVCVHGVNGTTCPLTAFGAKCDGVSDDTASFTFAYNTMMSRGGGEIDIPGVCVVNSVHLGDVAGSGVLWIKGITASATLLKLPTATTNPGSLLFSDGTTSLKGLVINNITFDCNNVHANNGFQNCVGAFNHTGSFEFDNNVVQNWDGYNGVWNLYHTTSATYLNNTFRNMGSSGFQYNVNGAMDISSQAKDTLARGNKCLSGGKCVFVDEWPVATEAHVNIIGNVSHCPTGYAVGNTDETGNGIDTVYGVIADNTQEGSGNFDSGIIVGGDSTANPLGETHVVVDNNIVTGITGANSVGIQFNWTSYATAMGNILKGASNLGTYAYYCNICEYCNFIAGSTTNFLSIVGAVGSGFGRDARGTSSFTNGPGFAYGGPNDSGQVFLNNMSFQGTQAIFADAIALTGSPTAGTAVCSQSRQGTVKIASCSLNGYANTGMAQLFNYPPPFYYFPDTARRQIPMLNKTPRGLQSSGAHLAVPTARDSDALRPNRFLNQRESALSPKKPSIPAI